MTNGKTYLDRLRDILIAYNIVRDQASLTIQHRDEYHRLRGFLSGTPTGPEFLESILGRPLMPFELNKLGIKQRNGQEK